MLVDACYEYLQYRSIDKSRMLFPVISLGLWHNFGGIARVRAFGAILRRAFDLGITHFDMGLESVDIIYSH